jgi:hypothetical protein
MRALLKMVRSAVGGTDEDGFMSAALGELDVMNTDRLAELRDAFGMRRGRAAALMGGALLDRIAAAGPEEIAAVSAQALTVAERLTLDSPAVRAAAARQRERFIRTFYDFQIAGGRAYVSEDMEVLCARIGARGGEAGAVIGDVARTHLERQVAAMLEDGKVSPAEDAALTALSTRLGVGTLNLGESAALLAEARRRHAVEHGPLPVVAAPLILQKNEVCHVHVFAEAVEIRTRTVRINYGGVTSSVRIIKGVSLRAGSIRVQREQEEYTHSFGQGDLVLTNKRLIWAGPNKTIAISRASIVDLDLFNDGIEVRKSTGKPVRFLYPRDLSVAILASRVIHHDGAPFPE